MKKTLLRLHWLSVDVAIGAVCCSLFFSNKIDFNIILALGTTTWLVYLIDRLLDIRQNSVLNTKRHLFHQKNELKIKLLILFLVLLNLINLFFLPLKALYFGLILGVVVFIYGLAVFKSKINPAYFKEISVSAIYAVGVGGCVSTNYELIFSFFLIVWQSLLILSKFETIESRLSNNFINLIGNRNYWILISCILAYSLFRFFLKFDTQNSLLFMMSVLLFCTAYFYKKLITNELYRILVEMIFWIPLLSKFYYD